MSVVQTNQMPDFVDDHPTIKILALSFLILVGVTLLTLNSVFGWSLPDLALLL